MFDVVLLVVVCLADLLLGAFVLANNPKLKLNRALSALCFTLIIWNLVSFLEDTGVSHTVLKMLAALDFSFASLMMMLFFIFCYQLYGRKIRYLPAAIVIIAAASVLMSLTGHTVGITLQDGHVHFVPKFGYDLVILLAIAALVGGLSLLISRYRRSSGRNQAQIKYIFSGMSLTAFLIVLTNVILPNDRPVSPQITRLGIYSTVFFVGASAYTIIRHRFLDIRLVVARTVAYVLLLATLAAIFAGSVLGLSALFFKDNSVDNGVKAAYISLAVLMAFLFQSLKRAFDRLSNSLFYRDAYDPQQLIDNLNGALVRSIDIEELLDKSARIISSTLKVEFCVFGVRIAQGEQTRLIGDGGRHLTPETADKIQEAGGSSAKTTIIADDLDARASKLKELLGLQRVGALVRLRGISVGRSHHSVYLLVGQKNSGGIYSEQDVGILDILADELVIAIQNSLRFEEIKRFNVTLQEKVDEATKELRRANSRLRELDQTKDEFISMASHQLRTPLTTIKGYLSMVLEGDVGPVTKDERKMIQQAFDSSERMVFLIGDLLNISRLQSGKFVIENKPTDLVKMVGDQVSQLKETAANHHLTLNFKKPDDFPALNIDETKIQQVVMNFMDNAIYYTPAGGSIEVALEVTDKEVSYTVTDTGLGVPKAEQHHLFAKFYRAGNARKMRPDGTGLGLFMAKKVITAQGGAIIFSSTEGKGSTFGFSFPRAKVAVSN